MFIPSSGWVHNPRHDPATAFSGIKVYFSPLIPAKRPKLKLGPCMVSEEFRANFDNWLVSKFGSVETFYVINERDLVVSSDWRKDLDGLKEALLNFLEQKNVGQH